jgi:hypothetical protein
MVFNAGGSVVVAYHRLLVVNVGEVERNLDSQESVAVALRRSNRTGFAREQDGISYFVFNMNT